MAPASTRKPYSSLTDAPTNLKEAIDWVLRVTGRDGKGLNKDECICGLAAAVTDLLQSVQLEYHGYEGDSKTGASEDEVDKHIKNLFSKVQGIDGTHVVRQLIDGMTRESQVARLIGWSKGAKDNELACTDCRCLIKPKDGIYLGRGCQRCSDSGGNKHRCTCNSGTCSADKECQCAKEGKCCKCCCKGKGCGCKDAKCICIEKDSYRSAYEGNTGSWVNGGYTITWKQLSDTTFENKDEKLTDSARRAYCARILLGSVCLIWSGVTYIYWTGKQYTDESKNSPYWNNHILDGSGLDDGTLSQWLQALGFPKAMLNDSGPGNRLDAVITNNFKENFYKGFYDPNTSAKDSYNNTAKEPAGLNVGGFIHAINRAAFGNGASVFPKDGNGADNIKNGSLYKLYILSCAYFTGLQKKAAERATQSTNNTTPKTIREILYWLSALPYSPAYPMILKHGKERLEKASPTNSKLSFKQTGRWFPINVQQVDLYAHFQAVTQYCPLVLIGIQGGIHSTKGTTPAIHALYANTECHFTYPEVQIQAYNQVVHYIRALFYQLYFLRKQCAVKVTCGGKWRECRYGDGVVSKGVISWMCLGCSPMEHDRNYRVKELEKGLVGLVKKLENVKVTEGVKSVGIKEVNDILVTIGKVVAQLGNAQEALERRKAAEIKGMIEQLKKAKGTLDEARTGLEKVNGGGLNGKLKEAKDALDNLTKNNGGGKLKDVENALGTAGGKGVQENKRQYSNAKDQISEAINGLRQVVEALKELAEKNEQNVGCHVKGPYNNFLKAIKDLQQICNFPKCHNCKDHSTKCGHEPQPKQCTQCLQQYMDGFPSPLQAFLEDRLPGFSCRITMDELDEWEKCNAGRTPSSDDYPLASSHSHHITAPGQCCPLPMGFRNQFYSGIRDCTGQRLYGILYFFSNDNMMQSCVYRLVRVTSALSATTPQVLGDVFGFFRGGVGNGLRGKNRQEVENDCNHTGDPSTDNIKYFCGWCASGLREQVKQIEWIPKGDDSKPGGHYMDKVGTALITIKGNGNKQTHEQGCKVAVTPSPQHIEKCHCDLSSLSDCTEGQCAKYISPLTGELYTAVSATFGNIYLSWILYLSDALHSGLESLSEAFRNIECRGCKGNCDPNKCKKGEHGTKSDKGSTGLCTCDSIVSCTGVLPVLYRHGFSYGNPFNLEGYHQKEKDQGDYSITESKDTKQCHEFLDSLNQVIDNKKQATSQKGQDNKHPLTELLKQVGQLQYDIRLPWIFVLTLAWLVAVLYLAFGAIWPLDWTHMRSHWLRGGAHQWQCMWYKVMTGRKGMELVEYFGREGVEEVKKDNSTLRTVLLSGAKGWGGG